MNYDVIISAVTTLAAAFLGAGSAFKLEDRARKRRRLRDVDVFDAFRFSLV